MKKYTLYFWIADNEGGYGVCLREAFTPLLGYNPNSGWRAKPSEKIGDFDSLAELAQLIKADNYCTEEEAENEAALFMREVVFL